jgi:hypothetical protein
LGIWRARRRRSEATAEPAPRVASISLDAEALEGVPDRPQVLDSGVLDQDLAAGHSREADERRHSMVGADPVRGTVQAQRRAR